MPPPGALKIFASGVAAPPTPLKLCPRTGMTAQYIWITEIWLGQNGVLFVLNYASLSDPLRNWMRGELVRDFMSTSIDPFRCPFAMLTSARTLLWEICYDIKGARPVEVLHGLVVHSQRSP